MYDKDIKESDISAAAADPRHKNFLFRLKKHTRKELGILLLITGGVSLLVWFIVYWSFTKELDAKIQSECYQDTQYIFCYDSKLEYRLTSDEDPETWKVPDHMLERNQKSMSLIFFPWLVLVWFIFITVVYASYWKYISSEPTV